jgi:hypothetical protein
MMHNALDVKKIVNLALTFDLTRRSFFGLGEFFPSRMGESLYLYSWSENDVEGRDFNFL